MQMRVCSRWALVFVVAGMIGRGAVEALPPVGGCGTSSITALDEGSRIGSNPALTASGRARIGDPFSVSVQGGPVCAHGCLLSSPTGSATFMRRFQATNFLAAPRLVRVFDLDTRGNASRLIDVRVPSQLCGTELLFQAFILDPEAAGGVAFTNGLRVFFGDR